MSALKVWLVQHSAYVGLSVIVLAGLVFSFESFIETLRYDALLVEQGQYWRVVSAWFTHLNMNHWLANLGGLALLGLLLPAKASWRGVTGFSLVVFVCAWLLFKSDYQGYVGLSGVLYGWLLIAAYGSKAYPVWVRWVLAVVLVGKVSLENMAPSVLPSSVGDFIGGPVAVESHLWGVMAGLLVISLARIVRRWP